MTTEIRTRMADDLDLLTARALVSLPDPVGTTPLLTVDQWREVALAFLLTIAREMSEKPTQTAQMVRAASEPGTPPPRSPA